MSKKVELSVVISVQDHDVLCDALPVFARQTCGLEKFEVVISHGANFSSQHLVDYYADQISIKRVLGSDSHRAVQQNYGVNAAAAPLILLWGDDFIPSENLVETHLQFHAQHPEETSASLGAAIFGECEVNDFMAWADESGRLFGVDFRHPQKIPKNFFYGAHSCVKKSLLIRAGMFDEDFLYDSWDDYELGLRLFACGMQMTCLPDAIAVHKDPTTLEERCRNYFHAGQNAYIFDQKYSGHWPWHEIVGVPAQSHQVRANFNRALFRVLKNQSSRNRWYLETLNAAFVKGYRVSEASFGRNRKAA